MWCFESLCILYHGDYQISRSCDNLCIMCVPLLPGNFFFSFWCYWGLSFMVLDLIGRCSTTWATPPAPLWFLAIFLDRVLHFFCLGPASNSDPPAYAFLVAGTSGMINPTWLVCCTLVSVTFCLGWPRTTDLCLLSSGYYRITVLSLFFETGCYYGVQNGLRLNPSALVSQVLELQVCTTLPSSHWSS
jgi:hypothetical protein